MKEYQGRIVLTLVDEAALFEIWINKETGGQNVYVRHVGEALGQEALQVDMLIRKVSAEQQIIVEHSENCRTIRLKAGPIEIIHFYPLTKLRVKSTVHILLCNDAELERLLNLKFNAESETKRQSSLFTRLLLKMRKLLRFWHPFLGSLAALFTLFK